MRMISFTHACFIAVASLFSLHGAKANSSGYRGNVNCHTSPQGPHSLGGSPPTFSFGVYSDSSCSTQLQSYDATSAGDSFICIAKTSSGSNAINGVFLFGYPSGASPGATNVVSGSIGSITADTGSSGVKAVSGCNGVTHTNSNTKQSVTAVWDPPAPGTGAITFRAHIMYSGFNYGTIEMTIQENFTVSSVTLDSLSINSTSLAITAQFSGPVQAADGGALGASAYTISSTGGTATVSDITSVTQGATAATWVIQPVISGVRNGAETVSISLASRASVQDSNGDWVAVPDPVPTVGLPAPSPSPSPSTTSTPSVIPSSSPTSSITPSSSPTPSVSGSPGADPSSTPTASASPSTSTSASTIPSASPSPSTSVLPSSSTSVSPSAAAVIAAVQFPADNMVPIGSDTSDPVMKLRWRLEDAQGSEFVAGTSTEQPTHVRMSLELQQAAPASTEWIGLAQSASGTMLSGTTGRAVVGLLGQSPPRVLPYDMVSSPSKSAVASSDAAGNLFLESGSFAGSAPTGSQAATDEARAVLVFRRPLVDAEGAAATDVQDGVWSAVEQASTGFIWAMGSMRQGSLDGIAYHSSRGTGSVVLRPTTVCDNALVCSGRGRCDVVQSTSGGLQCVCDPGHTGPSCSECAPGFTFDSTSSRCRLPPQGTDPAAMGPGAVSRVVLGLRLAVDFDQDYESDPDAFETQFAADVAGALAIEASRVLVKSVERGSVVVRFSIVPADTDTAAAYNDLVDSLGVQVNNASSPLRSQGTWTSNAAAGSLEVVDFVAPPPASTGFAGLSDGSFASRQELVSGLEVMWSLTNNADPGAGAAVVSGSGDAATDQYLHARVVHDATQGWFALGFNPNDATMPGTHAVVATLGAASAADSVREYDLSGRSGFGSGIARDAEASLTNTRLYERNGSWVMEFTRALDTGDSGDHVLPAGGSEGDLFMLMAKHGSASSIESSGAHSLAGRSVVSVDLSTGAVEAVALAGLIVAHGVMMGLAWAVLVPTGVIAARFCKQLGVTPAAPKAAAPVPASDGAGTDADAHHAAPASVPCWFRTHQIAQGLAVVLTIIAFALIATHVGSDEHFTSGHSIVGIIVVVLALIQGVLGAMRPHKGEPSRPMWEIAHKGFGYIASVLGLLAVILGAGLASDKAGIPSGGWVGVTAAAAAVWIVAYLVLLALEWMGATKEKDTDVGTEVVGPHTAATASKVGGGGGKDAEQA